MYWKELTKEQRPFFLYDFSIIKENLSFLEDYLNICHKKNKIFYSVKSNPNAFILKMLEPLIDGFDVSSLIELKTLLNLKVNPKRITFSGPGKTDESLQFALAADIKAIHLDSIEELLFILENQKLIKETGISLRLLSAKEESKLGLNKDDVQMAFSLLKDFKLKGLHTYLGRETFTEELYQETLESLDSMIKSHRQHFQTQPELFVGPGLPSFQTAKTNPLPSKTDFPITFELGRSLISRAGFYGAPFLSIKTDHRTLGILNGGIHHLGSSLLGVYSQKEEASYFYLIDGQVIKPNKSFSEINIYGSLCLAHDGLLPKALCPAKLKSGDWIVFKECGSYGLTASVNSFIGQDLPSEFALTIDPQTREHVILDISPKRFKIYHESFNL